MAVKKIEETLDQDIKLLGLVLNHLNKIEYLIKQREAEEVTIVDFFNLYRCASLSASIACQLTFYRRDLETLKQYAQALNLGDLSKAIKKKTNELRN